MPSHDELRACVRWMTLARVLEDRLRGLYRRGEIAGGVYLGTGQEALSASLGMALEPGRDIYAPSIRDMAGRLAWGETMDNVLRVHLGRRSGSMRGRDGNIHRGGLDTGLLPMISHLGAMVATVGGALLARRLRGEGAGAVGAAILGDGAMATGASHEGLNLVAVERLPVVVVVANNQLAYSTTNDRSFACADLVDRAVGYGIEGVSVDGEDPSACLDALAGAVARARADGGPQLVVARLLRLTGHGEHDDASYVPAALQEQARDCLEVGRAQLAARGDSEAAAAFEREARELVDAATERSLAEPEPDPEREDWSSYSERWLNQGLKP